MNPLRPFWNTLTGRREEEAEALQAVFFELRRGVPLPRALSLAAKSIGQGDTDDAGVPARDQTALELARWGRKPSPGPGVRQPWRTLFTAWQDFHQSGAVAEHGGGLVEKVRAIRASRVAAMQPWVLMVTLLGLLSLLGLLKLGATCLQIPFSMVTLDKQGFLLLLAWFEGFFRPTLLLFLGFGVASALYHWYLNRLVPRCLGNMDSEMLYYAASGLTAGETLPNVLRSGAQNLDLPTGQSRFLFALAKAIDSDAPFPAPGQDEAAQQMLCSWASLWQSGQKPEIETETTTMILSLIIGLRRRRLLTGAWAATMLPLLLIGLPAWLDLSSLEHNKPAPLSYHRTEPFRIGPGTPEVE